MTEDEEWQELERKQQVEKDTALRNHAQNRACEVMRGLNNDEISQMTLLRAFAMGYRDATMRSKDVTNKS